MCGRVGGPEDRRDIRGGVRVRGGAEGSGDGEVGGTGGGNRAAAVLEQRVNVSEVKVSINAGFLRSIQKISKKG